MMNNSNASYEEADCLNTIAGNIRISYIWVVFFLGFPTNLFSIVTVLAMRTMTPATFYVAVLALCDALTLITKLVGHQMTLHGAYFGSIGCKILFLSGYISATANWLLVFICAERCVSVCLPLKKHIIFTKRRAYMSTLILAVSVFVIFFVVYTVMRDSTPDGMHCGTLDEYLDFWTTGWYWIDVCLHLFFPLPIIVILTIIIILGLSRSRRERRSILHKGNGYDDGNSRLLKETERLERNITIMLILAAIVFMILSLPACIHILTYKKSSDIVVEAWWTLFDQIQFVCIDFSHAVNFFLYFFSSKKFRDQFIYLFTCKRWPKQIRKSVGSHSSMGYTTRYTFTRSADDVSHI